MLRTMRALRMRENLQINTKFTNKTKPYKTLIAQITLKHYGYTVELELMEQKTTCIWRE